MKRLKQSVSVVLSAVLLAIFCGVATRAQSPTGRILGNVTDPSGAPIPDAKVTVTNVGTQVTQVTTTGNDGFYQVPALPIGSYRVTIEKQGFQAQIFENQALQINQSLRLNGQLAIGSQTQSVEVAGQATAIETVNPTIGGTVVGEAIQQAPLNGRNVLDLAKLQPGVTETNPDNGSAGSYSIGGGRTDSVTFLLDGGLNNNLIDNSVVYNPNPDSIAEFRILQSDYSAEYGRNAGGIVSVVTKSGTNSLHGGAYDYIRNGDFDANSYFNKLEGLPRDTLKRNQYGGTLGGPIKKDRFFFFASYQGQRLTQREAPSIALTPVFTTAELGGDFSQAAGPNAPDPGVVAFLQANPFFQADPAKAAHGIIDPSKFNAAAVKYIAAGLIPSNASGLLPAVGYATNNDNELTTKFDFLVTQKDKLTATFGFNRNPTLDPFCVLGTCGADVPGFPNAGYIHNYFLHLTYYRTFSSNLLNELHFLAQRNQSLFGEPARNLTKPADLGFAINPDLATGPPTLDFSSGLRTGFVTGPTTAANNTVGVSDALSWIHGRNAWKMGGGISAYQNNQLVGAGLNGNFQFLGTLTGNDFADFLLGMPTTYSQSANARSDIRTKSTYAFLQDEWRATKHLTLTLGIRYEYNSPKYDTAGRTFSIIPGLQSTRFSGAPRGLVFPGDKGAPTGANFPDKDNFAPRLGFAWDPRGNGKTSIRGGFGVFYETLDGQDVAAYNGDIPFYSASFFGFPTGLTGNTCAASNQPNLVLTFFSDPFGSTCTQNIFPSKPLLSSNEDFGAAGLLPYGTGGFFYFDKVHQFTPYVYQYNLSVQRELVPDLALELNYVGSSGHGLSDLTDDDPFVLGTTKRVLNLGAGLSTCPDQTAGNPNLIGCSFGPVPAFGNHSKAHYNALETSLTKQMGDSRFFGRASFTLGYTYGNNIDDGSGTNQRSLHVPAYNPALFLAASDIDIRQRLTFSGAWDLPFDRLWGKGPKKLTQGWSLFPIVTWRTGFTMNVFANLPSAFNIGSEGPSAAGDPFLVNANVVGPVNAFNPKQIQTLVNPTFGSAPQTGSYWFNPGSFSSTQSSDNNSSDPNLCSELASEPKGTLPSDAQAVNCPSLRTYGGPRNSFRGPGSTNFDLSLSKTTPLVGDRLKLEIRGDFFNILNHAEFSNPDTTNTDSTFGQITGTAPPRIIQLVARFAF